VCLLFLLASLVAFLVLIQNVAGRIRVDALLSDLGETARRALPRHSPGANGQQVAVAIDNGDPFHLTGAGDT